MRRPAFVLALAAALTPPARATEPSPQTSELAASSSDDRTWALLESLCDTVGHRAAGSPGYERAVTWALARFAELGVPATRQDFTLDAWDRGQESLRMLAPLEEPLGVLGLGNSVPGTVEGPVKVVRRWEDLGPHLRGSIVLYDVPMPADLPPLEAYGKVARFRVRGASEAARHGALAVLVRSLTTRSLDTPHTGMMRYAEDLPRIPAAAIPTEQATRIARLAARGEVRLRLSLDSQTRSAVPSANVLAEIPGETSEVVLIGAHLDSWDVGCGAHDDGAGVVHVMEAMRRIRASGKLPRRTIRAVLFSNEERGLDGARAYLAQSGAQTHVAAIESDLGGGAPEAWSMEGSAAQRAWFLPLAARTGLPVDDTPESGADISVLEAQGTLRIGLRPDTVHYFDVHHTAADTLDKVDPAALARGAAVLAALTWELAQASSPPEPAPPRSEPPR